MERKRMYASGHFFEELMVVTFLNDLIIGNNAQLFDDMIRAVFECKMPLLGKLYYWRQGSYLDDARECLNARRETPSLIKFSCCSRFKRSMFLHFR